MIPFANQYTLREKDIQKASDLLGVEQAILVQMNNRNLLNNDYIRSLIIRADYERLMSGLHYIDDKTKAPLTTERIYSVLMSEYNIDSTALRRIIGRKFESSCFCNRCGVRMDQRSYDMYGGVCKNCAMDEMGF